MKEQARARAALAIRIIGVIAAAASTFIALKAFLRMDPHSSASLVAVVGWLPFLPLLQFGTSKPGYAEVRSTWDQNALDTLLLRRLLLLFGRLALIATCTFGLLAVCVGLAQGFRGSIFDLVLFALGAGSLAAGSFQRDIAYAVDKEVDYESAELLRRLTGVLCYTLLWFDKISLPQCGVLMCAAAIVSIWYVARVLQTCIRAAAGEPESPLRRDMSHTSLQKNSVRYFFFSLFETALYNLPIILLTFTPSAAALIYFGVWTRFFSLTVLPMRLWVDSRMNRVMSLHFRGERSSVWRVLTTEVLVGSVLLVGGCILAAALLGSEILAWIAPRDPISEHMLIASVTIWAAGNAVQHTFGSFVLSHSKGFRAAFRISSVSLGGVGVAVVAFYWSTARIELALLAGGVVYSTLAFLYVAEARGDLRSRAVAESC